MEKPGGKQLSLFAAGLSAILASSCCLGPLLLISLGFSGAWIGNLTAMEPYRPIFIIAALLAITAAGRNIWRPAKTCLPNDVCALPRVQYSYKILFWVVASLILIALGFPYFAPLFY